MWVVLGGNLLRKTARALAASTGTGSLEALAIFPLAPSASRAAPMLQWVSTTASAEVNIEGEDAKEAN
jgi:hypothetical protein